MKPGSKKPNDNLFSTAKSYSFQLLHSKVYGKWKGTAILISNSITFDRVITSLYSDFKSFDLVVLNLDKKVKTILVCIYRYGKLGRAFDTFLSEFTTLVSQLVLSCDYFMICGDFNLAWNKQVNSEIIKFKDLLDEFGLRCFNTAPVVPTHKKGNTIDIVICSEVTVSLMSCLILLLKTIILN